MAQEKTINTWAEVIDASQLKPEVREKFNLPSEGLIIKRIHKSDLSVSYEKMEGGLAGFIEENIGDCPNIPHFISLGRKQFC